MDIKIMIKMPAPTVKDIKPSNKHVDLKEKVQQYIYDVNSNFVESRQQWEYLKAAYTNLTNRKQLDDGMKELLKMIAPEIEKHGDGSEVNSATIHKYLE
jgi:hypothetical protein